MKLTSQSFEHQGSIPEKHAYASGNVSPHLAWNDVPPETQEFALLCDDPDAPRPTPWVHWVVAKIPADVREFPENSSLGVQGHNDFDEHGYGGPMPPPGHGVHHYHFVLYALDAPLEPSKPLTKTVLEKAMAGHVLAKAELIGTFER